jgi:hypothetical protein
MDALLQAAVEVEVLKRISQVEMAEPVEEAQDLQTSQPQYLELTTQAAAAAAQVSVQVFL